LYVQESARRLRREPMLAAAPGAGLGNNPCVTTVVHNSHMSEINLQALTPQRMLLASVAVAVVTIALKTAAWYVTGSVGLLSDAMESFVNLASAVFGLAMVTIAQRPADDDHPYGHHKAEYFSSGFEGALIIGAAAAIIWAAAERMLNPQPLAQIGWGLALSVVSSALNGLLAWVMFRAAKAHRSIALEADAKHLVTDVWTSAGVVIGIGAVMLTGWLWLDAVVAIGVAINILWEGGRLVWRSSQGLMDEAVEPEVMAEIQKTLDGFAHPTIRFDHLSTRRAGRRRFVDLHMHMPADWSLGRAAARASVEQALMSAVPGLRATIQLLPSDVEAHFGDEADLI
jgi:cation diffusion facilitator family transporter